MKRKRTHTILATITLISVILTSACSAGNASSTTSSAPETAVTTTAPAVTGTVMDRIDEPKAEATTAQTTATTAVTTTKPQETKKAETTTTTATTTAKPETTTTAATTKPTPEWTESKASGTKYVNTDCYSRKKAVLGAETVKLYSVNDKVTVTAKTDTGYFKLSDGSFIHGDYLSDNKVAQPAAPATKKTETSKPATTTKKQESKPKSIYEYPFDLEAIRQVIIDDAINNYGLVLAEDSTPDDSSWFPPLVIWKGVNPNVIRMRVSEQAESSYTGGHMKSGHYFNVYIETIPDLKKDENGNSIEGYAIYFLRGGPSRQ